MAVATVGAREEREVEGEEEVVTLVAVREAVARKVAHRVVLAVVMVVAAKAVAA
jgi:hypothetical protein